MEEDPRAGTRPPWRRRAGDGRDCGRCARGAPRARRRNARPGEAERRDVAQLQGTELRKTGDVEEGERLFVRGGLS